MKADSTLFVSVLVFAAVLLIAPDVEAVEPETGPAHFTDTHGAGGVCWLLGPMRHESPACERLYVGGLDWLVDQAVWDGNTCRWWLSTTAPQGHPNYRLITGEPAIIGPLVEGFRSTGKTAYKTAAVGGVREILLSAQWSPTSVGPGCYWGKRVGHSQGPGMVGGLLIDLYDIYPNPNLYRHIEGLFNWLRSEAVISVNGQDEYLAMWPTEKGGDEFRTGICWGNAGNLDLLVKGYEVFPQFAWSDGRTLRELINANLRWLESVAFEVDIPGQTEKGLAWPWMRIEEFTNNVGWGSGVSGIAAQFVSGYEINSAAGDPFAADCVDVARRAALTVIHLADTLPAFKRGACGGEGGIHFFLLELADALDTVPDPDFAEDCRESVGRIADRIMADTLLFNGRAVWKASTKFGQNAGSIAFDYGATGLAAVLYEIGHELDRSDCVVRALDTVEFLRLNTYWNVPVGCKWPMIIPHDIDADGDGVLDDWDQFPNNGDAARDADGDAMGNLFEWLIVDHDPDDPITGFETVLPGDNYDGDPYTNIEEFQNGTDPTEPDP